MYHEMTKMIVGLASSQDVLARLSIRSCRELSRAGTLVEAKICKTDYPDQYEYGRFIGFMTIEIDPIWTSSKYHGHNAPNLLKLMCFPAALKRITHHYCQANPLLFRIFCQSLHRSLMDFLAGRLSEPYD
jgi:hypothetical protein